MTPDRYTIAETMLDVGQGHSLYVQEWGNQNAQTAFIFLHGGPGSGCSDQHKKFFNPDKNRVIFFDQRGSGKSTPYGSLKNNQTEDLIEDINRIADKFKLTKFVFVGGSWGSTLSLAYALKYPEKVEAMILRGLFTGSKSEIDALEKGEFKSLFPDVWDAFLSKTPKKYQSDPAKFHMTQALGKDKTAMKKSVYAYAELEGSVISLDDRTRTMSFDDFDPYPTRIEMHYTSNLCFMPDNYILDNAQKLTMPVWLIQGRYDIVCPPITAYKLSKTLPNNHLIWTTAGHSGNDRANFDATKVAIASFN